jgi:P27 family predicted phage terminase small subunit
MGGRGSGGRNRKSTAQKKAEGNRGKRALNENEPAALPGEPPMPEFVAKDMVVRQVWKELVAILADYGVLRKTDGIAIGALCSNYVLFAQADASVRKYGHVIVTELDTETGVSVMKVNPSVRVRSDALKQLRLGWQAFGLDPRSAAGIQLPDDPEKPKTGLDLIKLAKNAKDEIVH